MNLQGFLKQSTAVTVVILMVDATDHITGKTGLAAGLTVYQSKAGAATGAITPTSVTEIDSTNAKGLYALALNTTTWTNTLGEMILHITATGADPADYKWWVSARLPDDLAYPATTGRSMVVDAAGLVDANVVKLGPSGSGSVQTARDVGGSVLLSAGTGTGQLDFTLGVVKSNVAQWLASVPNALQSGRVDSYIGALAASVIAAASFAANALDAVWSTTTRVLTAGTNIVLAKGTGVTGLNDLDAAGVRSAVGLASANLDTQLAAIQSDTDNLQTRLPAALTADGNMKSDMLRVNGTGQTAGDLAALLATIASYVDTEVAAIKAKTDNLPAAPAATGDAMALTAGERNSTADAIVARTLGAESYAAKGVVPTVGQALLMLLQLLSERSLVSTTLTIKKLDGSNTAMTFTLDSATDPTSQTRA